MTFKGLKPIVYGGREVWPLVEGGKGVSATNHASSGAWAAAGGIGTVIDKLAYEVGTLGGGDAMETVILNDTIGGVTFSNVNLVEGTATNLVDTNDFVNALVRINGGDDTNSASSDFILSFPSP